MNSQRKSKIAIFNNMSIKSKMITFTLIIIIFAGGIATFGFFQINSLTDKLHEVQSEDWVLANSYSSIISDVNEQLNAMNTYVNGNFSAKSDFQFQDSSIKQDINNISFVLGNSENNFSIVKMDYTNFSSIVQGSDGLFALTDQFYNSSNELSVDQNSFNLLETNIDSLLDMLVSQTSVETGHNNLTVMYQVQDLNLAFLDARIVVSEALSNTNNKNINNFISEFSFIYDGQNNTESIVNELSNVNNSIIGALKDNSIGNESSSIYSQIVELLQIGNSTFPSWIQWITASQSGLISKKITENSLKYQTNSLLQQSEVIRNQMKNLLLNLESNAASEMNDLVSSSDIASVAMVFLSVVDAVVVFSIGILFARSISKPIKKVAEISKTLSTGDLTQDIDIINRTDEIGILFTSFGIMNTFLKNIISEITKLSQTLLTSAEEMASSSEEVNASAEEISSVAQQISKNTQEQALQISSSSKYSLNLGKIFDEKIKEVMHTTSLIESLSSQVNMLALNASIEAARAGEYGRGFSVVAENIRKLADDSKSAVTKIKNTINGLQTSLSDSINYIRESIEKVASLAGETASGAEESSAATEEQSAIIQELTASAQDLSHIAYNLEQLINKFQI